LAEKTATTPNGSRIRSSGISTRRARRQSGNICKNCTGRRSTWRARSAPT
ncbi:unnamed protein product, partial [Polarella glacialis]